MEEVQKPRGREYLGRLLGGGFISAGLEEWYSLRDERKEEIYSR